MATKKSVKQNTKSTKKSSSKKSKNSNASNTATSKKNTSKKNKKKNKTVRNKKKNIAKIQKRSPSSTKPINLDTNMNIIKVAIPSMSIFERMHDRIMDSIHSDDRSETVENIHIDIDHDVEPNDADGIDNHKPMILLIHADWCGHCKQLMPQWDDMSKQIDNNDDRVLTIKKIEVSDLDSELANLENAGIIDVNVMKPNVNGYPTMGSITNKTFTKYEGGRSTDELVAWVDSVQKSVSP